MSHDKDDKDLWPDDPDAPSSPEELAAAGALRDELATDTPESAWLKAHLRPSTWEDSLGEVRARGLARAAREVVQTRRAMVPMQPSRLPSWRQLRRALIGSGGLLGSAVLLLIFSSVLLDQVGRPEVGARSRAAQAQLLRASFFLKESPTQRLELLIEDRLQVLRQSGYRGARRGAQLALAGGGR